MSDYQYQRGVNNSFVFQGDMDALKEANDLLTGKEWYYRLAKQLRHYDFTEDEQDTVLQAAFEIAENLDKEQ